jgi:hypothetical protein
MSLTTFGIYELYWFYRNWRVVRDHERLTISPFWRAFFAPFWTFSLGKHFEAEAKARGIVLTLPVVALGVSYLVLTALWRLPDPFWLLSTLSFIPMLPFEFAARRLNGNGDLAIPTFGRYSGWNIAWLIVGSILLILSVIGTFLGDGAT